MRMILVSCALLLAVPVAADDSSLPEIEGASQPTANWLISPQPQPHDFVAGSQAGVRHVINARGVTEDPGWDQSALLSALGVEHHHLPITSAEEIAREDVEEFDRILAAIGDEPAMMHCGSGTRIGALFALRAAWLHDETPEAAVEIGRSHGLGRLEPKVREILGLPADPD